MLPSLCDRVHSSSRLASLLLHPLVKGVPSPPDLPTDKLPIVVQLYFWVLVKANQASSSDTSGASNSLKGGDARDISGESRRRRCWGMYLSIESTAKGWILGTTQRHHLTRISFIRYISSRRAFRVVRARLCRDPVTRSCACWPSRREEGVIFRRSGEYSGLFIALSAFASGLAYWSRTELSNAFVSLFSPAA